jgi:uncharacterized protein YgbK (DUF1537 family)
MSDQEFQSKLEAYHAIEELFNWELTNLNEGLLPQLRASGSTQTPESLASLSKTIEVKVKTMKNLGQTMGNVVKNIMKEQESQRKEMGEWI